MQVNAEAHILCILLISLSFSLSLVCEEWGLDLKDADIHNETRVLYRPSSASNWNDGGGTWRFAVQGGWRQAAGSEQVTGSSAPSSAVPRHESRRYQFVLTTSFRPACTTCCRFSSLSVHPFFVYRSFLFFPLAFLALFVFSIPEVERIKN